MPNLHRPTQHATTLSSRVASRRAGVNWVGDNRRQSAGVVNNSAPIVSYRNKQHKWAA